MPRDAAAPIEPPTNQQVRSALRARRWIRRFGGLLLATLFLVLSVYASARRTDFGTWQGAGLTTMIVFGVELLRKSVLAIRAKKIDLELSFLLLALAFFGVWNFTSIPMDFAIAIVLMVLTLGTRVAVALVVTLVAASMQPAYQIVAGLPLQEAVGRSCLALGIGIVSSLVLKQHFDHRLSQNALKLQKEIDRLRDHTRSYRLLEGPKESSRSGVEQIQLSVKFALDMLKRSLGAHTVLLVMIHNDRENKRKTLKLTEVVTDCPKIAEGPFGLGEGIFGAVLRRKGAVGVTAIRGGSRIPYYPDPISESTTLSLLAAPVLDGNDIIGVLCVDRKGTESDRGFAMHEEQLVTSASTFIHRAIENERVFGKLERAKTEQERLYVAVQRLSGALTEAQVIEAGVESARSIAAFDFAAITVVNESDSPRGLMRQHEIRAVAGANQLEGLVGLRFGDNGGLVAQAVKSKCSLPHRGDHDPNTQVIFTRRHPVNIEGDTEWDTLDGDGPDASNLRSILVVPLVLRDRVLGTLVLGAQRRGAFRELSNEGKSTGARTILEVLATHIATSLSNARMVAKLEELATTDGLTGLLNKRVLLELGAQKIRVADRYSRPLALIQTDIDHFKKVNDTYGHDVGDQVIKGLAGILRRLKRATDHVARFGGEEFVIICEETDADGAMKLSERVREELEKTVFHSTQGPFSVTCSLGVAMFPSNGSTWDSIYKATDEALYASKHGGRNRSTLAGVKEPVEAAHSSRRRAVS